MNTPTTAAKVKRLKVDWYLILIVSMGVAATFAPARGDVALELAWASKFAIGLVFFLHGARLPREAVLQGLLHWRLHLLILAVTYGLFPALCVAITHLPTWIAPPELAAGIVLLGCLPSTIQSSIAFVGVARGNVPAAVASASASNMIGVFLTPLLAGLLMHAKGAVGAGAFWSIVLQLLAPFVAGQLLRPWIGGFVARHNGVLSRFDRGTILLIVYTAFVFSYAISVAGVGESLTIWLVGLKLARLEFFFALFILYTILGCLVESLGMIVITVPLLYPVLLKYGIDPVWFGIILVMFIELGQISPPIGINLFVIQSIWDGKIGDIVLGTIPFHLIMFVLLVMLVFWPEIALWLPQHTGSG